MGIMTRFAFLKSHAETKRSPGTWELMNCLSSPTGFTAEKVSCVNCLRASLKTCCSWEVRRVSLGRLGVLTLVVYSPVRVLLNVNLSANHTSPYSLQICSFVREHSARGSNNNPGNHRRVGAHGQIKRDKNVIIEVSGRSWECLCFTPCLVE